MVSLLTAGAIAMGSYWQGDRWAKTQIQTRYTSIAKTLSGASYPLNQQVVESLARLTDTELIGVRRRGSLSTNSLGVATTDIAEKIATLAVTSEAIASEPIRLGTSEYRYGVFLRGGPGASSDDVHRVVVLFDDSKLRSARFRAAALPLVTGLSTMFLLTTVVLFFARRFIGRLHRLSLQVDRIAEGQFDGEVDVGENDEIGLLGSGVRRMSGQLQQMWDSLQRTQGEKLLHQIAGGLAHQLRNSLTGARMAVELHHAKCKSDDDSIQMALSQLEQTEDSVRRLLLVAAGKQDNNRPGELLTAVNDVRETLTPTAEHLNVNVQWQIDDQLTGRQITDAPSLSAALSNLVLNAIQASQNVTIAVDACENETAIITVSDDGPGPPTDVQQSLFEPFVTSKPEGLGLGLPLVKRAAERLGGNVTWSREQDMTVFRLTVQTLLLQ
ncbi:Sensor protein ZraS [Planctomycetes bacterium K23_9]|uniref:histidine kinase n=2 Tax=Stieleria marina TaxID=1930275 RepID=A0A517P0U3_9BACT|nr:Sensor protein ZraS [Planctomycetes bacterium K23_9]